MHWLELGTRGCDFRVPAHLGGLRTRSMHGEAINAGVEVQLEIRSVSSTMPTQNANLGVPFAMPMAATSEPDGTAFMNMAMLHPRCRSRLMRASQGAAPCKTRQL